MFAKSKRLTRQIIIGIASRYENNLVKLQNATILYKFTIIASSK